MVRRHCPEWEWLFLAALVVAVLFAYQPVWQGGFLWDDDAHVTRPELCSWRGLCHIWFKLGATQQYYPLLHSAFWVEHRLWGDATLGYHIVNILLHATAAVLAFVILRRLAIPGAYLAAAIFALHPVHVESVAWITEQKNTLSAVFYLGAMLCYLRFDQTRRCSLYRWTLGLFCLGLLSKTVTATLPAALLVIFWWQRGRLSWRRDVWPLVPFFALGLVAGLFTAWVERTLIGAEGAAFQLSPIERCLIAGRAVWFYLGKLVWPTPLIFIYPRWDVSQAVWWQYLFPAATILLFALLWALRGRWRGPLAGMLFFVGTLFPVLGFCNVYPFLFSFVADHFQYLASLGVIVLFSSGAALLFARWGIGEHWIGRTTCLLPLVALGTLTWQQSRVYVDGETLYRTTIQENPGWWLAYNNLGVALKARKQFDEALALYRQTLKIKPDYAEAYVNIGGILAARGQADEAIAYYRQALKFKPGLAAAYYNIGRVLASRGQADEAIACYQQALKVDPDFALAYNDLAAILAGRGRIEEAIAQYEELLKLTPDFPEAYCNLGAALAQQRKIGAAMDCYRQALKVNADYAPAHLNLGNVFARQGQFEEAIVHYRKALQIDPQYVPARNHLGLALLKQGQADAAMDQFRQILQFKADDPEAHYQLGMALTDRGQFPEAVTHYRKVLQSQPAHVLAQNKLAWLLATCPEASIRDGAKAVELAQQAIKLAGHEDPGLLDTLAAAYAEAGQFPQAVATAHKALEMAEQQDNGALADALREQIKLYEAGKAYREVSSPSAPPPNP
jgi:tetratricopeptide (TPR) repeat protein